MTEDERFRMAVEATLANEGGYANDLQDPGGETNFGISKRSYPALDIRALTREDAVAIYRRDFWDANRLGEIEHSGVAAKVFDLAVNMGARRAVKILQRVVNETGEPVTVDGVLGARTLEAANSAPNPAWVVDRMRIIAATYYLGLNKPRFLAGWIRRALA